MKYNPGDLIRFAEPTTFSVDGKTNLFIVKVNEVGIFLGRVEKLCSTYSDLQYTYKCIIKGQTVITFGFYRDRDFYRCAKLVQAL